LGFFSQTHFYNLRETGKQPLSIIFSAASLVLLFIGWFIFAPPALGGQTSYIIIIGNSMEPKFHFGDLALIREANSYAIGDIVTYQQPEIGTIFHRIIAIQNGRYTLRGDNNTWDDSYHPQSSEILGKYWFFIPSAGKYLQSLRKPANFAFLVVAFAIVFIYLLQTDGKSKKLLDVRKKNKMSENSDATANPLDWLYIISIIGFVALIIAFVSFTHPIETTVADNYTYTNYGHFEYFSEVPEDIYESNQLETGDPIFRQINNSINIVFSYELVSNRKVNVTGTYRMLAIIKDTTGWEKSIEIIPPSLIQESSFTSSAVLDLTEVDNVIDNFESQTGIINKRYTLILQPQVEIQGLIGERTLEESFMPELTFFLDDQKLTLTDNLSDNNAVLNPTLGGSIMGSSSSPNTISFLGLKINVLVARMISIYMIGATLIALFWFNKKFGNLITPKNVSAGK
jgi:signal peptidase I